MMQKELLNKDPVERCSWKNQLRCTSFDLVNRGKDVFSMKYYMYFDRVPKINASSEVNKHEHASCNTLSLFASYSLFI